MLDLHDCSLLDEEEILALGPSIFGSVAIDLSPLQELLVLFVKFLGDLDLLGGVFALVQEKVVVYVLIAYLFLEEIFDFLQIGQRVHIRDLILFGVVVGFVVIKLLVVADSRIDSVYQCLALDQQIC